MTRQVHISLFLWLHGTATVSSFSDYHIISSKSLRDRPTLSASAGRAKYFNFVNRGGQSITTPRPPDATQAAAIVSYRKQRA
mmetsp:Transcript_4740/g.9925  ORF Transcript_4740/g.9925 Transcript_4740/m.9925 type:complete len:82 (-) Transcript_4740:1792-2037(-)